MARCGRLSLVLGVVSAVSAGPVGAQVRFSGEAGGSYTVEVMSWRDVPFRSVVRQQYDYSCGSAALATLLRYHYGADVGEAELFRAMWDSGEQAKIRKVGFSLLDMKRALAGRGYKADGYRVSLDQLGRVKTPAIALIELGRYRHFVVVKGVDATRVLVGDPALGLKIWPRAEFEKMWNGIAFVIHDRKDAAPVFDLASDWRPWATAPLGRPLPLTDDSLAAVTRELPPIYQIRQVVDLSPILE
jgi:hypothetical protein